MLRVIGLVLLLSASPLLLAKPLVYCADASPEGFDPGLWDSSGTSNVSRQLFQGLLAFRRGGTELQPRLAQSWQAAPDGLSYTFRLRRDVAFHRTAYFQPKRRLNADDVLFTFGRFIDAGHPFNRAFAATFVYPQNLGLAQLIAGIDRLDDYTVRFRLRSPNVGFPSYLAMAFAGIQSAEYGAQLLAAGQAARINSAPVGTGPYRFKSYQKDAVLRLDANPDYWGKPQRSEAVVFSMVADPNVRVQKLLAGECQIAAPLRDIDVGALAGKPAIRLAHIAGLNISYLGFNLSRPALRQRQVREALDIAIDRAALFKALFPRGDALQAASAFPPALAGYDASLKNEYDPARARQLLAEAGYAQGLALDLWALPIARPTNPNGQLMAQMIQQDWARIGVRATIKSYEWGEYLRRANRGEHDVYMSGWSGESGEADDFLAPNLSCAANPGGFKFCNAEFDRLLAQARATADPARRAALYRAAQAIFKRERPWMPMAHASIYIGMRREVQGFVMAPNGSMDFENVYRD